MALFEALYGRRCRSPIGWFEVGETQVAYELESPPELAVVHPVFHVSMLCKCLGEPLRVIPIEGIEIVGDLSFEEVPVAILDRQVRKLRSRNIASVKVLWRNQNTEETTWEAEEDVKTKYPYLFQKLSGGS
ncbi:uncharacterized protein LOC124885894 [Capsicum annuum]|uniref:uncharacterized protein LOC124885894 n=1 Tax=Capsicum annuum TaxID=4072 RepID=UPI001FB14917|nr:uncharacterized protein LOC124885894 [Capsicum annuum]